MIHLTNLAVWSVGRGSGGRLTCGAAVSRKSHQIIARETQWQWTWPQLLRHRDVHNQHGPFTHTSEHGVLGGEVLTVVAGGGTPARDKTISLGTIYRGCGTTQAYGTARRIHYHEYTRDWHKLLITLLPEYHTHSCMPY